MPEDLKTRIESAEAGIRGLLEQSNPVSYAQALRQLGGLRRLYEQQRQELQSSQGDGEYADRRLVQIDHATEALGAYAYAINQPSREDYLDSSREAGDYSESERYHEALRATTAPSREELERMKADAEKVIGIFQKSLAQQ
ncbi:hypothetical protein GF396_00075 [Candidatus Pacearchaeota archaeon]|nr:hypothetical protein [Candidatus Pacearchaeota archaeon]